MTELPKSQALVEPLLMYLKTLGRAASNEGIFNAITKELGISEQLLAQIHPGSRTEFKYRLAWARTKANSARLISSPSRKHWEISKN